MQIFQKTSLFLSAVAARIAALTIIISVPAMAGSLELSLDAKSGGPGKFAAEEIPSASAPLPKVQSGIEANEQAFLKAVLAKDVATLNALLAEDFVYVHENGLISTKAQFLTNFVAKSYAAAELKQKEPARQYGGTVFTIGTGTSS